MAFAVFDAVKKENLRLVIGNYNCLIQVCARCQTAARLPEILKGIKAAGFEFDRHTYNVLIDLHTTTGNVPAGALFLYIFFSHFG